MRSALHVMLLGDTANEDMITAGLLVLPPLGDRAQLVFLCALLRTRGFFGKGAWS